jgi:uncharacterized membrane protein YgcG
MKMQINIVAITMLAMIILVGCGDNGLQEEQDVNSVVDTISQLEKEFNNSNSRDQRIILYNGLKDLKDGYINDGENELATFDNVLSSMGDWFFDSYVEMISSVEVQSNEYQNKKNELVDLMVNEINNAHTGFLSAIRTFNNECEDEECEHEHGFIMVSTVASQHYYEFVYNRMDYTENEFFNDLDSSIEGYIIEFEKVKELITNEGIITDSTRVMELFERISENVNELMLMMDDVIDVDNSYENTLDNKFNWFIEHYEDLLAYAKDRERIAHEVAFEIVTQAGPGGVTFDPEFESLRDISAVNRQIYSLITLKQLLEVDGVVSTSDIEKFNMIIDEHIEEYSKELERLEAEKTARERQQQSIRRSSGGGSNRSSGDGSGGGSSGNESGSGGDFVIRFIPWDELDMRMNVTCFLCGLQMEVRWWSGNPTPPDDMCDPCVGYYLKQGINPRTLPRP